MDLINPEPTGIGELILLQDAESVFRGWQAVSFQITPSKTWGALGHLEAGRFSRPGDAPVLWALTESGMAPGSEAAESVYQQTQIASANMGRAWDAPGTSSVPAPPSAAQITAGQFGEPTPWDPVAGGLITPDEAHIRERLPGRSEEFYAAATRQIYATGADYYDSVEAGLTSSFKAPESDHSLFSMIKGTSRWLMLTLDVIPEGFDAVARAASRVKGGQMTIPEALGGMFGFDREASASVGIPLFSYLRAAWEGERLNMGTGLFARGDIATDIAAQLAAYDEMTHGPMDERGQRHGGLTQDDFEIARAQGGGRVMVIGLDGFAQEAKTLDEWKQLRDTAGRAALVQSMQSRSAEQAVLGQPIGSFGEQIFDEATQIRHQKTGDYYTSGTGTTLASGFGAAPDTHAFNMVSGSLDFTKQMMDLRGLGIAKKGLTVLSKLGRFVGLAGESGDLARGTRTAVRIVEGADVPAAGNAAADIYRGSLNADRAVNALARSSDQALTAANATVGALRNTAVRIGEQTGKVMSPAKIDSLIDQAANGNYTAKKWAENIISQSGDETVDAAQAVANLEAVTARGGVHLTRGSYGVAQVSDEILASARREVEDLQGLLTNRKAAAIPDPTNGKIMLTFDADLGRAANTMDTLISRLKDQHLAARRLAAAHREASLTLQERWTRYGWGGLSTSERSKRVQEELAEAMAEARRVGVNTDDMAGVYKMGLRGDEMVERMANDIATGLMRDRWITKRQAARLLGGDDAAEESVENLMRVLMRSDGDNLIMQGAHAVKPELKAGQFERLIAGSGKAAQLVDQLAAANSIRQVMAILGPTIEWSGKMNPALVSALARATTRGEVVDIMRRMMMGEVFKAPKITLMGKAARVANLSTVGGLSVGAVVGAADQLEQGGSVGDILGGALSGAVLGTMAGSGLGSTAGYLMGGANRTIEDVADAMDLMLAGTREMTADFLRARGKDMGAAGIGVSSPTMLQYAYQTSPLGRRLSRTAETQMNLSDPTDIFYKLSDYSKSMGIDLDEVVTLMSREMDGVVDVKKVLRSSYKTVDEYQEALTGLAKEGWVRTGRYEMDRVFHEVAAMQSNNPARSYEIFRRFAEIVDAHLLDAGMPEQYRRLLTDFARESEQRFLGAINAAGAPSALMQYKVNGRVLDGSLGYRLESELWSGHLHLPPPAEVQRAVNQLDMVGKVTQLFTGKDVVRQVMDNLGRLRHGDDWLPITPELERNVVQRTLRYMTSTVWAPVVLLGRPFAFLSRVLGEDQARMAASGLDTIFTHPFNWISAVMGNFGMFKNQVRGVAARSIIPDEVFRGADNLTDDFLDNMTNWDLAESARHSLAIYDRRLVREAKMFSSNTWVGVERGQGNYLNALTTEFKQLVSDPMVRHMARGVQNARVADPVRNTYRWLTESSQGQRVLDDWGRQFHNKTQFADAISEENLMAFLHDQYARLQLKTGGDWIFVWDGAVVNSYGVTLTTEEIARRAIDVSENGYQIVRKGDDELITMVGGGKMDVLRESETGRLLTRKERRAMEKAGIGEVNYTEESMRIRDGITDERWDAIKDVLGDKHTVWERHAATLGYDEVADPRFPRVVKGSRTDTLTLKEKKQLFDYWGDALDRMYDGWLGAPSRIFSRQPVMGNFYWERVGMLYGSMTPELQTAFRRIAEKEKSWKYVRTISNEFKAKGLGAKGTITDMHIADINAKAYAVERTRDTLFDLHRQRNFVDGMRIIAPFVGPYVEALEAWARVGTSGAGPVIWRRGTQGVQHLWNTTGVGDQPDWYGGGYFWVNPETGDEMFNYPLISRFVPSWLQSGPTGVGQNPLSGRAEGLNIVFGPENQAAGEQSEISGLGVPWSVVNIGGGPVLQMTVGPFLKSREGMAAEIGQELFPYGTPANPLELLPYNLRKLWEGQLGEDSQHELIAHTMDQMGAMWANGEVGEGANFRFDTTQPGGIDDAMEEARRRAVRFNWFEAFARSMLPTITTPQLVAAVADVPGLDSEMLLTIDALANEARTLTSEEGAQWFITPDGYRISTEGDYETTTAYMNQKYGLDMFSAEFLSLPLTDRPYPLAFTKSGLAWMKSHGPIMEDLKSTAALLMPDYANASSNEEYDFEAFEYAVDRGFATRFTFDEQKVEIESRLLKLRNARIEREAIEMFGDPDRISPEQRVKMDNWTAMMKQIAASQYEAGVIEDSQATKALKEIVGWDRIDWTQYDLTEDEQATVATVQWYLAQRNAAMVIAQGYGVSQLSNVGDTEEQKAIMDGLRRDLATVVNRQMSYAVETGMNLGNFPYIWTEYLQPELDTGEEFDPLAAISKIKTWGMDWNADMANMANITDTGIADTEGIYAD